MKTQQSIAGLNWTIATAREQLLLFILKNEVARTAANRLDVLQIRTAAMKTAQAGARRREQEEDYFAVASS
jgi:hypothetical protein